MTVVRQAIFRPQDESHVEKQWIVKGQEIPEGWHESREAALASWEPVKRGPGRPRKD